FDPRGILIIKGSALFPGVGNAPINTNNSGVADQILRGDPDLVLNADGYTTYFDYHAANPDYGSPRSIPGNLNPFKRYFLDQSAGPFDFAAPAGWNVMGMGALEETQEFVLSGAKLATGDYDFDFVLDVCYGASATRPTRGNPTYYLPEFSRKEAWEVGVEVIASNLQVGDKTSRATIEVTAKDWQELAIVNGGFPAGNQGGMVRYASRIKQVDACIPGVVIAKVTALTPFSGGGTNTNPLKYRVTLRNELQNLSQTDFWGLVAVRDELYQVSATGPQGIPAPPPGVKSPHEGMNIRDYSAYQYFEVTLGPAVDDPPIADLTRTTPRSVLDGTSVKLDGLLSDDDIGITTYEFDPEGDGTYIDNSAAIPPYEFNFVYTTPPNTQTIYPATLRVTDTSGQQAVTSVAISVTTTPDAPPTAIITAPSPWTADSTTSVLLDGTASTDDFGITKYEWNPGDGTGWIDNGLAPNMSHTFPGVVGTPQNYSVQLRVTDTALQSTTVNKTIAITVTDLPPNADLQVTPVSAGTDVPRDVILDACASTDDYGVIDYRFDPGDGTGWSAWGPACTFPYSYIAFIDSTFVPRVEVRDASFQVDQAVNSVSVTVPGGCLITGITGPAALNKGESANFSVAAVGLLPGGYQWTESDPDLQFVGATNTPTVTVLATGSSPFANGSSFTFTGNGGVCQYTQNLTCYDIVPTGPGSLRQYVNRSEDGIDTNNLGTRVTVFASVVPSTAGVPITFNFHDPDEPSYQGFDVAAVITNFEADALTDDNRGDNKRPDGTAGPGQYANGFEDPVLSGTYVNQCIRSTNGVGSASAVFATSRFGGDNYTFSVTGDPAGNGFDITSNLAPVLTVWRRFHIPIYSMWDPTGSVDQFFYMPDFASVNAQFAPSYTEMLFSTELAPNPPAPNAFGGMDYLSPMDASSAASQINYVNNAANYNVPAEQYAPAKPGIFGYGHNQYSPLGVIGLCTVSFNPALIPPPSSAIASKPYSTTDYVGMARGQMLVFGINAVNQSKVFTHELGHALGLNHSDTGSPGNPNTVKYGASGVGIMRPAVNTAEAALWTESEIDFLRGINLDATNGNIMRGPYYEGG
ncbi:MAG: PKD domain-containing protein, partial [bacterium]